MVKQISVSDDAYEWLMKKSSEDSIKENKRVSIADVVDKLIQKKR